MAKDASYRWQSWRKQGALSPETSKARNKRIQRQVGASRKLPPTERQAAFLRDRGLKVPATRGEASAAIDRVKPRWQ